MKRSFRLACITLLYGMGVASTANADEQNTPSYDLDIDALPLMAAVKLLSDETGIEILYFSEIAEGVTSSPVKGEFTPQEALETMLVRTDLEVVQLDQVGAVAIRPVDDQGGDSGQKNVGPAPILMAQNTSSQAQTTVRRSDEGSNRDGADDNMTATPLEEIIVTGTNIRGVRNQTTPIIVFDRKDIDLSGATTVEEFMRTVPQNFASQTPISGDSANPFVGNDSAVAQGTGVDLRGLGAGSTLTLLNGRRMTVSGTGSFVDISVLPLGAISRVEVLTDGASAVYGADAVGGVVNFITRTDFEGFEVSGGYGKVTNGSLEEYSLGAAGGVNWGTGGGLIGFEYFDAKPLLTSERDYIDTTIAEPNGTLGPDTQKRSLTGSLNQQITDRLSVGVDLLQTYRETRSQESSGSRLSRQSEQETLFTNARLEYDVSDNIVAAIYIDYATETTDSDVESTPGVFDKSSFENELVVVEGQLDGHLLEIPSGSIAFATGVQYRDESFSDDFTPFFDGANREIVALYGEALVPLFGEGGPLPLGKKAELSIAYRYEDYSDFGDTLNPRFGVHWEINEQFGLRGSYSESFRAPTLLQLFTPQNAVITEFPTSAYTAATPPPQDPRLSPGQTSVLLLGGGSPDLEPETADTWAFGMVFKPKFAEGLNVEANFFDIFYQDRLEQIFIVDILQNPQFSELLQLPPDPAFIAGIFELGQSGEIPLFINTLPFEPSPQDVQSLIISGAANLSSREVRGLDLSVLYTREVGDGVISTRLNAVHILDYKARLTDTAEESEQVNTIYRPVETKLRADLSWSQGGFTVLGAVNYTSSYHNIDSSIAAGIDSWTTVDMTFTYDTRRNTNRSSFDDIRFGVSVQNVFDEDPPFVQTIDGLNYDPSNANPFGRIVRLTISKSF